VLAVRVALGRGTRNTPRSTSRGWMGSVVTRAQLGAPRHGTTVVWDATSCRNAAPVTMRQLN
jgi:hypothetical protein